MRKYLDIDLQTRVVSEKKLPGEETARAGRYFIARTLVDCGAATVDPLSSHNPIIFSAGPFAGSNFSNANRVSVGCKSPLTGGIKESNAGGSFALAMGHLHIAGFTLHNAASEWTVLHIRKDGSISFDDAREMLGEGNSETAARLHDKYGRKTSLAICGPVGEYQGLLAGIAFSDTDKRPSRFAARGGVGAVLGSKRIKAIVVDMDKMPPFHARNKLIGAVREYARKLGDDKFIKVYTDLGTASMADYLNHVGGLPVNNFSAGRLVDTDEKPMTMGGAYIREQNISRGGNPSHACMPGCVIKCSNVYVDADGKEIVSPVEYETLGLMGTNCGISDPDELARLNFKANDLGIDSIETGATLALLLEAGLAEFGNVNFLHAALDEIGAGTEQGRLWAQGAARVGAHYGLARVPVIKHQAISAYDPRVVEVTGISMMVTAQGADHTAGNMPTFASRDKSIEQLVDASMNCQVDFAATDSLGLCLFGRSVTTTQLDFITEAINAAHGTALTPDFFRELGRVTLQLETEFNRAAGFTETDDELPRFFYTEPLEPSNKVARFHAAAINRCVRDWWRQTAPV